MTEANTANDPATSTPPVAPVAPANTAGELPEWARQQVSSANQEAANFRVQLRQEQQARAALEEQIATLTVEKETATTAHTTVQTDFDKLVTTIKAEVPTEYVFAFANTLKGDNEEALATHAASLKEMFNLATVSSPAVDRTQGLGTSTDTQGPEHEFASFLNSKLSH